MSTPTLETLDAATPAATRRRPRWLVAGAVAAAVAAAVAVPTALTVLTRPDAPASPGRPTEVVPAASGFAPALVVAAENTPRVLVDEPGWRVARLEGFGRPSGEVEFRRDGRSLELAWYPADAYDLYYRDRAHDMTAEPVALLGLESAMFRYGKDDFTTIRPAEDGSFLEVRASGGDRAAYLALLGHLEKVDVETWLKAMPAWVVKPDEADATVRAMLKGIELPPGFDAGSIPTDQVADRDHFAVEVTRAVGCAWVARWRQATSSGDTVAAQRAADALVASHRWPVLQQMRGQGGWSPAFWAAADKLAQGDDSTWAGLGCR